MIVGQLRGSLWAAVRRSWLRIARGAAMAGLAAFAVSEILALLLERSHETAFTHLISLIVGLLAAYSTAITVGIFEAVRGIFTTIGDIEGELRRGYDAATGTPSSVVDAEHDTSRRQGA